MKRHVISIVRVLACGLVAFFLGGLSIDLLGTSWWSVLIAVITVLSVMVFAVRREVPDAQA